MSREFELHKEVELDASPEQVWEAIATGPGISSWFMGPHEIEPRVGGKMTLSIGDFSEQATITAWDPSKRLAYRGDAGTDGLYRFQGGGQQIGVGHHLFAEGVSGEKAAKAWQAWLNRVFSG